MSKPFKGVVNIDIKDSVPDWGGGGGLIVGRSGAEPVADDYAGEAPWAFVGGTIKRVFIDVSGEPFVDLAQEARAAFAHQ